MKTGIKYGLWAALATTILFVIVHFINPRYNFNLPFGMLVLGITYLIFMVWAGFKERKRMGGTLGFGEAFLVAMATYIVASFIGTIVTLLAIKFVPGLDEIALEESMRQSTNLMESMGMPEEAMLEGKEELRKQMESGENFGLASLTLNWAASIFFPGLIYGLIAALIAKKNPAKA